MSERVDLAMCAHKFRDDDPVGHGSLLPRSSAIAAANIGNARWGRGTHWYVDQDRCPKCIGPLSMGKILRECNNKACDYTRLISDDEDAQEHYSGVK